MPVTYVVSYANESFRGWEEYGTYDTRAEAERVAKFLRKQGNRAKVSFRTHAVTFKD